MFIIQLFAAFQRNLCHGLFSTFHFDLLISRLVCLIIGCAAQVSDLLQLCLCRNLLEMIFEYTEDVGLY